MLTWLLCVFVLTPLAVIQTVCAVMLVYAPICMKDGVIGVMLVSVLLLLLVNKIVRLIRFGTGTSMIYIILDFITAALRLPLQLISNLLAFIAIFTHWNVDARNEPSIEIDGILDSICIYLLEFEFGMAPRIEVKKQKNNGPQIYPTDSDEVKAQKSFAYLKSYKWKNVRYQFKLLLLTLLHSWIAVLILFLAIEDLEMFLQIIIVLVAFCAYIWLCMATATMKDVEMDYDYYDPVTKTELTFDAADVLKGGDIKPVKTKVISKAGMKNKFTIRMILYFIFGMLIHINQFIIFVLALLIPAGKKVLPCRAKDIEFESYGAKLLHFFFGFIII